MTGIRALPEARLADYLAPGEALVVREGEHATVNPSVVRRVEQAAVFEGNDGLDALNQLNRTLRDQPELTRALLDAAKNADPHPGAHARTDLVPWLRGLGADEGIAALSEPELSSMIALVERAVGDAERAPDRDARRELVALARRGEVPGGGPDASATAIRASWALLVTCARNGVTDPQLCRDIASDALSPPRQMPRGLVRDLARLCETIGLSTSKGVHFNDSYVYFGGSKRPAQTTLEGKVWAAPATMKEMSFATLQRELRAPESVLFKATTGAHKILSSLLYTTQLADPGDPSRKGVNLSLVPLGAADRVTRETKEMTGRFDGNNAEKAVQVARTLQADDRDLRQTFADRAFAQKMNPLGLVEDSGFYLDLGRENEAGFLREIHRLLFTGETPLLTPADEWLFESAGQSGFPGPNLKPLQEKLPGGFPQLMGLIYDAAEAVGLDELPYRMVSTFTIVSPRLDEEYTKVCKAGGTFLSRAEFEKRLSTIPNGEVFNARFLMVPDGQVGEPKTFAELGDALFTQSSKQLPAEDPRRMFFEWLVRDVVGSRPARPDHHTPIRLASVGGSPTGGLTDVDLRSAPRSADLLGHPQALDFGEVDAVLASPIATDARTAVEDPNLVLLTRLWVRKQLPVYMGTPFIVDNRDGGFDRALSVFTRMSRDGQLASEIPLLWVARTDAELETFVQRTRDLVEGRPALKRATVDAHQSAFPSRNRALVPLHDKPDVFVASGHATESERASDEAEKVTRFVTDRARVITGGGWDKGGMGATHAAFLRHHLERAMNTGTLDPDVAANLQRYVGPKGLNVRKLLKHMPELVDHLARKGVIPARDFLGTSTKDFLLMEAPDGRVPPGTHYVDAGNIARRLEILLSAGAVTVLQGSIGSLEEIVEAVRKHKALRAAGGSFPDGTPANAGKVIVVNRDGVWDAIVEDGLEELPFLHVVDSADAAIAILDTHLDEVQARKREKSSSLHSGWMAVLSPQRQ